jgi:cell division protein FtsQ
VSSGGARGSRPDALPSGDVPSAEVLDELLQAFSIDVTDRARFDEIDLTSPEVERLLAPNDTPNPAPDVESRPPVPPVEDEGPGGEGSPGDHMPPAQQAAQGEGEDSERTPSPQRYVITDESIPDAVYVKGNLATDSAGERSTIFIDGQRSTGETISVEAAAAATRIEPRLRERRVAVKRAAGRKRIKWALVATVVVAIVVGGLAVLGSSLFAVEDVEVEGAVYTDERALAAVVEDLRGTPVLRVDTDAAEQELEAIPWVEDARVTTDFPDRVKIEIRERTPVVAYQGADDRYRVIDTEGRVLDVLDGQPVAYLQLTSDERPPLAAGQFAPRGFAAAASLVQAMTPEVARRAESVTVAPDGGDLRLQLRGGTEVRFGAAEELVAKLVRLQTVLEDHANEAISVIDVSTNEVTIR